MNGKSRVKACLAEARRAAGLAALADNAPEEVFEERKNLSDIQVSRGNDELDPSEEDCRNSVGSGENRVSGIPFMPITMTFASDLVGAKYLDYATDWRVLVDGQLAMAERFGVDHVSAISDPAVESGDLGGGVLFHDDAPPANDEDHSLFADKKLLGSVPVLDPGSGRRMSNRLEAVTAFSKSVGDHLLVEGWVEGPCAEAADLRGISRLMTDFFDDPEFVASLVDFVTEQEIAFALAQVKAGAAIIGVGDAASSLVGPGLFAEFMVSSHQRYVQAIHAAGAIARLHICGRTARLMPFVAQLGYDIVDLDTESPIVSARCHLGPGVVILGNIDTVSVVRGGKTEAVHAALGSCWRDAGMHAYIAGAGCEIPRDSPHLNVLAMRDFAARTSRQ